MSLSFNCRCGASLNVPDLLAGQRGRCPGCGGTVKIPVPGSETIVEPSSLTRPGAMISKLPVSWLNERK